MPDFFPTISKGACFSPCRRYRYSLWRHWAGDDDDTRRNAIFIGLNPSTADERKDDPTIRRCIGFAQSWGFEGMVMLNIFAFRATDPAKMKAQPDPIGEENDVFIKAVCEPRDLVVACWGVHGKHLGRDQQIAKLVENLKCFGVTADGSPKHPLYLPKAAKLVEWRR